MLFTFFANKILRFSSKLLVSFVALMGLLGVSLQAEPGKEDACPKSPFAVRELTQHIFSYLPNDLKSARAVSQDWKNNAEAIYSRLLTQKRNSFFEENEIKYSVPGVFIQDVLNAFLEEDGFLVIPPRLISALPHQTVAASLSLDDLLSQEKRASSCYRALFQEDLPEGEAKTTALEHLLAVLSAKDIYLRKDEGAKESKGFFERVGPQLEERLKFLAKASPHLSFKDDRSQEQLKVLEKKPHTIVITGVQLKASKDTLEKLISTNPEHRVLLSVKNADFLGACGFYFTSHKVPQNLRHLRMINPAKDVIQTQIVFLAFCKNLITFSLSLPVEKAIDHSFLDHCEELRALSLNLPEVRRIGLYFLQHCKKLTTLDLNLPNLTKIKRGFLKRCNSLPESEKEKVRAFLRSRGIEWK